LIDLILLIYAVFVDISGKVKNLSLKSNFFTSFCLCIQHCRYYAENEN